MDDTSLYKKGMAATGGQTKTRLAIVSTYDELCGIAGYTVAIKRQLDPIYDVTVFELDQYLLRNTNKKVRKIGDEHILKMCEELKKFPVVNIQFEYGTLGVSNKDILRRFKWLADAAPSLVITFHTIIAPPLPMASEFLEGYKQARSWKYIAGLKSIGKSLQPNMGVKTYSYIRKLQETKPVHIIVHTGRDARMMRYVQEFKNVHSHPLAYYSQSELKDIEARKVPVVVNQSRNAKAKKPIIVGLFGFLGPYKGFETAIRAAHWLPNDYHIVIFGGLHPHAIRKNQPVDPYIEKLLKEAFADKLFNPDLEDMEKSMFSRMLRKPRTGTIKRAGPDQKHHPYDISNRVHFMGAQSDDDFARGIAACDMVVFPYLEVGQSSSAPISMAVELGKRVIASRTVAYLQFGKYYPGRVEYFDIGNHIELSQRIKAKAKPFSNASQFNAKTNAAFYEKILNEAASAQVTHTV